MPQPAVHECPLVWISGSTAFSGINPKLGVARSLAFGRLAFGISIDDIELRPLSDFAVQRAPAHAHQLRGFRAIAARLEERLAQ